MSRPPRARESVLDAYAALLIADGERAATVEATARTAGVSKGGLLYHFASKDALNEALIEHMRALALSDTEAIRTAPEGPIAAFMRISTMTGSPADRAIVAVSRLAQSGNPAAVEALRGLRTAWEDAIRPHARDETALQMVLLVSDGLYFNAALTIGSVLGPVPEGEELAALIAFVENAAQR
ncbi:TetR/AcrR family transcriptional regulator [Microbacterium sp. LRZ72]|uniref:TetR/AcrR family transcriptional regulator n=1 Tax=Microbacterium sp. LRZ72 TaxID=2942481 RepID=UPI0029A8BDA2|nr:TetR/AcrR family transcriptional regulator [Microbacterium sp. LRZ72]MDX2375650.1 TetR/AcrR family transcriptional regulator [Microbacterium sp. LRZ72]